jgi:hypothetical protein
MNILFDKVRDLLIQNVDWYTMLILNTLFWQIHEIGILEIFMLSFLTHNLICNGFDS